MSTSRRRDSSNALVRSWIRNLFARPVTRPMRKAAHRARLAVEALEDRLAPATLTVTSLADDGSSGTLRSQIAAAAPAGDTIIFQTGLSGTITLSASRGELQLSNSLTITGPGANTISVGFVNTQFSPHHRVFEIFSGATDTISGLTITGGFLPSGGGGINNAGALTLISCTVSGNSSASGGGGINNAGTLTITSSTISGNNCPDRGGGIFNGGTLTITSSTVSGNSSGGPGGGIESSGTLTITSSTISGNVSAGGGIAAGGGIDMFSGNGTITNCTVSGNLAAGSTQFNGGQGGGINNFGTLTITSTTVSGNSVAGATVVTGVGESPLSHGGGVAGSMTLRNTIVTGNLNNTRYVSGSVTTTADDISGSVSASSSYNLIGTGGSGGLTNGVNHNQVGVANPGLGSLADNGGPTLTMALLAGSPALGAGDPALASTTDQRGVTRPTPVDIGAFQTAFQTASTTTAVTTSGTPSTYGQSVTFTATVTGTSTPTGSVNFVIDNGTPVAGTVGSTTSTTATWTWTTSTLTAGNHTVAASYVGSGFFTNSNGALSSGQTVNRANATVVVTPYTLTYDGQSHTATVTSITGVNGETGATVGTVTLNTTNTNAGTYASDSWSFTGTANYNNIAATTITDTINRANATVVVTPYTVTYDGQSHTATVTSLFGVNGESGATVGTVDVSNTTHTNAGTYASDSWSFTGTPNYNNIASTTITDIINKADLYVTANDQTKITGEANPTFTVRYSGFVPGEGPGVLGGTLTFSTSATTGSPPGTYAITPSGLTSGNYSIHFVNGTLTVLSYAQATTVLKGQVDGAHLAQGLQSSLDSQLQGAIASFSAGDTTSGENQLGAFINHVRAQRGQGIGAALADAWMAYAQGIINAVG
jgi:hypothetical protein